MHSQPKPIEDPMMRKLVLLVQKHLPNSTHQARLGLLAQLHALEQEAVKTNTDPSTLRSIHSAEGFVQRYDRMTSSVQRLDN